MSAADDQVNGQPGEEPGAGDGDDHEGAEATTGDVGAGPAGDNGDDEMEAIAEPPAGGR